MTICYAYLDMARHGAAKIALVDYSDRAQPPSLRYGATLPALGTRRSSKSEGGFRRQPDNSAAIACIQHKSLPNPTQLHGYNEGFVINAG